MRHLMLWAALSVAGIAGGCWNNTPAADDEIPEEVAEENLLYGIPIDNYRLEQNEIVSGETMGGILGRYGVSAVTVDRLDRAARDIFPLGGIRAGNPAPVYKQCYR